MADDDTLDPAEIEAAAAVAAAIMAGTPVAPLDPERIAKIEARRDAELAELMAERWFAEQERQEQQRLEVEARQNAERRATLERQRELADRRSAALAASDAAAAARATRQRLAQIEAQELRARHQAAHWAQWQAVADGIGKLAAMHGPQPVPLTERIGALEEQADPQPERSAWHRANWGD
jgi:hypothetical protein